MKAGRELDALIAEKVMGIPKYWSVWFACSHYGNFNDLNEAQAYATKIQGDFKAFVVPYSDEPNYSTNIADAWEVVHKLREGNLWFVIKQDNSSGWEAKFWKGLPDGWFPTEEYYAVALTPALAICLAALKAVSQEGQG